MTGKLYLISVPIGNFDDITIRALDVLRKVDFVVCEEFKEGVKLLNHYSIEKPIKCLNEHNEKDSSYEIVNILKEGKNVGIITDHGTPLIEDPGSYLIKLAINEKIDITAIPGPSSILTGLILSGFCTKKFLYYGLLSPKREERNKELSRLRNFDYTTIFLDAPYRLSSLLQSILAVFGGSRRICLASNLTMMNEKIYRGTIKEVLEDLKSDDRKKFEFVLVVEGKNKLGRE